jgi:iron complex transport system ATP-binding protein
MLELQNFRLDGAKSSKRETFYATGLTCLLGLNGCGKTTLLRAISGFNPNFEGHICLNQVELPQSASQRALKLSWCPERLETPFSYRVLEIVLLGRFPIHKGSPTRTDLHATYQILDRIGASHLANRDIREISSGEFRKIMLARSLNQETPLLIFDEPTANLDPQSAVEIMTLLKETAKDKIVLTSMHDLRLASHFANRIWLMKDFTVSHSSHSLELLTPELLRTYFQVDYAIHADLGPIQLYN